MKIEAYSFGSMVVDGKEYQNDLLVFSDKVKSNWRRKRGHSLRSEDLEEVYEYQPEVLVVGKGAYGRMKIPEDTRRKIKNKEIELKAAETARALEMFNREIERGANVAGAFHLTC